MNKTNLHSVIMISYLGEYPNCAKDRGRKFRRAVDSFLANEYEGKELIIVSDGCEKTNAIYSKEYTHDRNVSLIIAPKQEPGYPGSLRSVGLLLAKGETVSYLDSDDYISPSFISELRAQFKPEDIWCYYDAYTADVNREFLSIPKIKDQEIIEELQEFRWTILPAALKAKKVGSPNISHIKKVNRNCLWKHWDGKEGESEDWDFIRQVMDFYPAPKCLESPPGYYLCHYRAGGSDV